MEGERTGADQRATLARDYAWIREAAAVSADGDRALVRVWGDRAREMIGGLTTNDVAALEPGRSLYAFVLTPKGRPVAELRVLAISPAELWLDLPAACREELAGHLNRYLPPMYARHAPLEERVRLTVLGPAWADVVAGALPGSRGVGALEPLEALRLDDTVVLVRREPIEGPGADLYVARERGGALRERLEESATAAGGGPVGLAALEAWRIERGVPVYGREIDLDVLPQETGQTARAIDFEKGCYTGQEVVARIHYRGHVNRRLVGLRLPSGVGEAGDELFEAERARGWITSVADSPRLARIGLGYVRRDTGPGTRLALDAAGETSVEVVELPFPGAGYAEA